MAHNIDIELKDFLIVYDEEEFMIWSKEQYENYVSKALSYGATPAVRVVTHFNKEDSLFAALQPKEAIEPIKQEQPQDEYIKVKSMWDLNNIYQRQFIFHGFETSAPVPEDRFPFIKKAIEQAINQSQEQPKQEAIEDAVLKDFFDAGYDYRSSLTPEIIEEYGVDSCRNFKECLSDYKKAQPKQEAIEGKEYVFTLEKLEAIKKVAIMTDGVIALKNTTQRINNQNKK